MRHPYASAGQPVSRKEPPCSLRTKASQPLCPPSASQTAHHQRSVGDGDIEALALLVDLSEEIDAAMAEAVKGPRARGYSWAEIGYWLGITRQAAQQRWGTSKR